MPDLEPEPDLNDQQLMSMLHGEGVNVGVGVGRLAGSGTWMSAFKLNQFQLLHVGG